MKHIVLKYYRKTEIVSLFVVFILSFVLMEGIMLTSLIENRHNSAERVFALICILLCGLMFAGFFLWFFFDARKWLDITEDSVAYMSGKKVIRTVSKDQIIAYGCFSQDERFIPGFPFFCYATVDEVSAVARKYWHWRKRIYRKKQLEELEKTPEGMWILQMSIYIYGEHYHFTGKPKGFSVNSITKEELKAIAELWQRKPMLLGTMPIYYPWKFI